MRYNNAQITHCEQPKCCLSRWLSAISAALAVGTDHPSLSSGVSRGMKGLFLPHYFWGEGGRVGAKEHEDYLITS